MLITFWSLYILFYMGEYELGQAKATGVDNVRVLFFI